MKTVNSGLTSDRASRLKDTEGHRFKKPKYPQNEKSDAQWLAENNHCMADDGRSIANWDKPFSEKLTF